MDKYSSMVKKIKAEFFDIFGAIAFFYITIISIFGLLNNGNLPRLQNLILLFVGVGGLIVDCIIVTKTYLMRRNEK